MCKNQNCDLFHFLFTDAVVECIKTWSKKFVDKGEDPACPICRENIGPETSWVGMQDEFQYLVQVNKKFRMEKVKIRFLTKQIKRLQKECDILKQDKFRIKFWTRKIKRLQKACKMLKQEKINAKQNATDDDDDVICIN